LARTARPDDGIGVADAPRRSGVPFLDHGFRPFFLGASLWAAIALAIWVATVGGFIDLPSAFDPLHWHQHEMTFGFAGGVVAGFVLTAVPNWTGNLPVRGGRLAVLFLVWLAGRIAVLTSAEIGALAAAIIDVGFLLGLSVLVFREIVIGQNWRNLPICGLITLFAAANAATHLESASGAASEYGVRSGLAVLILLIALIGGRIVPSFTRNWLAKRKAPPPAPFSPFDRACLVVAAAALVAWILRPAWSPTGVMLVAAGLLHFLRVCRWQGLRTLSEPLVTILHVGYLWLALGLLLLGASILVPAVPATAALHALTAGAIGTMTLAVMTRASLGHTGRPLTSGAGTTVIYGLVTVGAILRVIAQNPPPALDPDVMLNLSALSWGGAFALFALVYGPMLYGPHRT